MPRFYITTHSDAGSTWEAIDAQHRLLVDFENVEAAEDWANELSDKLNANPHGIEMYVIIHDKATVLSAEKAEKLILEDLYDDEDEEEEDEE
jgi:hypothetical protein